MIELQFPSYVWPKRGAVDNNVQVPYDVVVNISFPYSMYYVVLRREFKILSRLGKDLWSQKDTVDLGWYNSTLRYEDGGTVWGGISGDCGSFQIKYAFDFYTDDKKTNLIKSIEVRSFFYIKGDVYKYQQLFSKIWKAWDFCCQQGITTETLSDELLCKYGRDWKGKNPKLTIYWFLPVGVGYSTDPYWNPDDNLKNWEHWSVGEYQYYSDIGVWLSPRKCVLSWEKYNTYQTYPGLHLQKTLTADVKLDKDRYVLFKDLLASVSVKDVNDNTITEVKTNFGYKSDGDSNIQTFYIPIGQLPVGDHPLYVAILGKGPNSNLTDTIQSKEWVFDGSKKYEVGKTLIEIADAYVLKSDGTKIQLYDWELEYLNGTCYFVLGNTEDYDTTDTIHIDYRKYENVGTINIVYSAIPINLYIEDKESIEKYGKRAVKEIFLPVQDIETAKTWANKFLKKYAYPQIQRKYDFADLYLDGDIPTVGDYIDGQKIVEIELTYESGEISGTCIAGDVDKAILEIIANRF